MGENNMGIEIEKFIKGRTRRLSLKEYNRYKETGVLPTIEKSMKYRKWNSLTLLTYCQYVLTTLIIIICLIWLMFQLLSLII